MPRDDDGLRVLARSSRLATAATPAQLCAECGARCVSCTSRFYAPTDAVAALPRGLRARQRRCDGQAAQHRLHPEGAMRHLHRAHPRQFAHRPHSTKPCCRCCCSGHADGRDPDYGLPPFDASARRTPTTPGTRDSCETVQKPPNGSPECSGSRFAAELLESIPSAVAWLERERRAATHAARGTARRDALARVPARNTVESAAEVARGAPPRDSAPRARQARVRDR